MACTPFTALAVATEHLSKNVYQSAKQGDPFYNAIPRGTYPLNVGVTATAFETTNIEPTSDTPPFTDITLVNGQPTTGGNRLCNLTYDTVDVGYIARTYSPRQYTLRGPIICAQDLSYDHEPKTFLTNYVRQLREYATRTMSFALRENYMFFSEKYTNGTLAGAASTAVSAITQMPTMQLTEGYLDQVSDDLNAQNAFSGNSSGFTTYGTDGPMYTLLIEPQDAKIILRTGGAEIRSDYRAQVTSGLNEISFIKRLASAQTLGSFRFYMTQFMPRYNIVGGALVRVPTFINQNVTAGVQSIVNPAWKTAQVRTAIVLNEQVMEAQMVAPVRSGGADINFSATNYGGQWEFITGANLLGLDCVDPFRDLGAHFARFVYAPKPVQPRFGKVIFYRGCGASANLISSNYAYC
jgi:hypothetical protein